MRPKSTWNSGIKAEFGWFGSRINISFLIAYFFLIFPHVWKIEEKCKPQIWKTSFFFFSIFLVFFHLQISTSLALLNVLHIEGYAFSLILHFCFSFNHICLTQDIELQANKSWSYDFKSEVLEFLYVSSTFHVIDMICLIDLIFFPVSFEKPECITNELDSRVQWSK